MTHKVKIPLPPYNTFAVVNEDHPLMEAIKAGVVHPMLQPLLAMLSKQRPKWEFIAENSPHGYESGTNIRCYTSLSVHEDGEKLGNLDVAYFRGNTTHGASNSRISAARERSSWAYTKDTRKLASIILKNFYLKTIEETMDTAAEKMQNVTYGIRREAGSKYDNNKRRIDKAVTQFLLDQWDMFTSTLSDSALLDAANGFKEGMQAMKAAATLDMGIGTPQKSAALLVERGEHFYLREYKSGNEEGTDRKVTLDDLPDAVKGKLALLKLMPEKDFVHNVGVRVLADTYLVTEVEEQS